MAERGDAIPITVYLDRKTVNRIDEWAKKLGQNRSRMTRFLVEDGVIACGIEYDIVTSAPAIMIMNLVRQMNGKPPVGQPLPEVSKVQGAAPAA